jgi:hypothetical protein
VGQDNDNFVTQGLADARDWAWGKAKDLAARGAVITNTGPGAAGMGRPGGIDVGKLAEDQAQSLGRGDPALKKKKKPVPATPPVYKTVSDSMLAGGGASDENS